MSDTTLHGADLAQHHDDHHDHDHHDDGKLTFGFWVYILSDSMLFATMFATFAVLSSSFASGVRPFELFSMGFVLVETALLLVSSFTFGMAIIGMNEHNMRKMAIWLVITFLLGAGFLSLEIYEFTHLAHEGATPQTSGYWSAFFTLVGMHGMHVFGGLVWMALMIIPLRRDGLSEENKGRISCLSLFWHFLDVIWICVFSFVYLIGGMS